MPYLCAILGGIPRLFGLFLILALTTTGPAPTAAQAGSLPAPNPAALLGETGKAEIFWQLYFAPAADLPVPMQASPAQYDRLNGQLILALHLEAAKDHYFYAPFAVPEAEGQSAPGEPGKLAPPAPVDPELEDFIRFPTALLLDEQGHPLPKIKIFYPPGQTKYDAQLEAELPVYTTPPVLLIPLPWQSLERRLSLDVEALICSASSCTPFRETLTIGLNRDSWSAGLPETAPFTLARYRQIPAETPAVPADQPDQPGQQGQLGQQGLPNQPGQSGQADLAASAEGDALPPAYYQAIFNPVYHQQALEVSGLGRAVLLGLLAGFILNFMPCVLPVVTLKLGALAGLGGLGSLGGQNDSARLARRRLRSYSLFFSLGVLVWFAALFAIIGLADLMWGQLFQSQALLLGLSILLFLLALSLLGVFRLPLLNISYGQPGQPHQAAAGHSLPRQAFAGGVLATLLATPCSGPLLGGVLGWAVGQPLFFLGLTLLSVGLGMAAPFILLSLRPGLGRFLPKPGPWSLVLEKIMAFLLLGTVIYLLSMLPQEKLIVTLAALLLFGLAAWLWGRKNSARFSFSAFSALAVAALACYLAFSVSPPRQAQWQNFTPGNFAQILGKKNLLLDFTADWCVNCRALEATTLRASNLVKWQKDYDLVYIKVDLTRDNAAGAELLKAMNSASIPLLAIFPAGAKHRAPVVLRDLVTGKQVEAALKQALE